MPLHSSGGNYSAARPSFRCNRNAGQVMSGNPLFITTSWDDGHPLDMKVAGLLMKYGLAATFYVPLRNRREVMDRDQLCELSSVFEIGGHTVTHCDLLTVPFRVSKTEIHHCKDALQ